MIKAQQLPTFDHLRVNNVVNPVVETIWIDREIQWTPTTRALDLAQVRRVAREELIVEQRSLIKALDLEAHGYSRPERNGAAVKSVPGGTGGNNNNTPARPTELPVGNRPTNTQVTEGPQALVRVIDDATSEQTVQVLDIPVTLHTDDPVVANSNSGPIPKQSF